MRRLASVRALLAALVLLAGLFVVPLAPARAEGETDDRDALRERIELIRQLPPEEQERLRAALDRFRKLSPEKQREIRQRAKRVGKERLRELVGRDVGQLRKRRHSLDQERREIVRSLGGEQRFASFPPVQRKYLANMAVREFQRHVRRQLLEIGGPEMMEAFNRMPRDEKKERLTEALRAVEDRLLSEESEESQAAYRAMSPKEQRRMRKSFLAEYRLSLVPSFAGIFETRVMRPFMRKDEAARQAVAQRWDRRARWFEMRKRLEREVGVSREAVELLEDMGPEEWARVRDVYVRTQSEGVTPEERRLRLETEIRELHGRTSVDADARGRRRGKHKARLRRLLRERERSPDPR